MCANWFSTGIELFTWLNIRLMSGVVAPSRHGKQLNPICFPGGCIRTRFLSHFVLSTDRIIRLVCPALRFSRRNVVDLPHYLISASTRLQPPSATSWRFLLLFPSVGGNEARSPRCSCNRITGASCSSPSVTLKSSHFTFTLEFELSSFQNGPVLTNTLYLLQSLSI